MSKSSALVHAITQPICPQRTTVSSGGGRWKTFFSTDIRRCTLRRKALAAVEQCSMGANEVRSSDGTASVTFPLPYKIIAYFEHEETYLKYGTMRTVTDSMFNLEMKSEFLYKKQINSLLFSKLQYYIFDGFYVGIRCIIFQSILMWVFSPIDFPRYKILFLNRPRFLYQLCFCTYLKNQDVHSYTSKI